MLAHPDQRCSGGVASDRSFSLSVNQHFAATEVDLVFQSHRNALRRASGVEFAIVGHNAVHPRGSAARQSAHRLPGAQLTTLNPACEAAENSVGTKDKLYGEA